jgi:hypothetical protein
MLFLFFTGKIILLCPYSHSLGLELRRYVIFSGEQKRKQDGSYRLAISI